MNPKGRVIFVGIHNKPGMEPLDSRTKSGKIIDEVIKGLEGRECVKTNLFYTIEIPSLPIERLSHATTWKKRFNPNPADVIILLGNAVLMRFPYLHELNTVCVHHPASRHIKRDQYIKDLISKILNNVK